MSSLSILQQNLKWIDDNLHSLTYEELRTILGKFLPRIPIVLTSFDNSPFFFQQLQYSGKNVIYRARTMDNPENLPHKYVQDLSYMPNNKLEFIRDYGRVNKPHQAMFYGAFSPSTAAIEVLHANANFIANPITFLTISVWEIISPMTLAEVIVTEEQHNKMHEGLPDSFASKYDNPFFNEQSSWLDSLGLSDLERYAFDYFANKFCSFDEGNAHYKLSNYYADRVFNRFPEHPNEEGEPIDGIIYSSIPSTYQEKNIVLSPETVDSKIRFIAAEHVVVAAAGSFQIAPLDRAHADKDGTLIWNKAEWEKKQAAAE